MILHAVIVIVVAMLLHWKHRKTRIPQIRTVLLMHKQFYPTQLTLQRHDRIVFVNKDHIRHNIVNDHLAIANSPLLRPTESFQINFSVPGKFHLKSSLYPEMDPLPVTVKQ